MFCYVCEVDFKEFSHLNLAKGDAEYNKILCKVIGILEKHGYKDEAPLIVQMLHKDLSERITVDKLLPLFKTKF
jgi:hypothetical protein